MKALKHVSSFEMNFNEIYQSLWPQVYKFIYFKVQNEEEAEELTQDVFQRTYKQINRKVICKDKMKSYIFMAARNIVYDLWRKRGRSPKMIQLSKLNEKGLQLEDENAMVETNGRETIVYEFRHSNEEPFNKIWIDIETKMPLKTELNNIENRKLINQFTQLNVNVEIDDSEFVYEPQVGIQVVELNSKSSLKAISESWSNIDGLLAQIPEDFEVDKVVKLDDDILHDYLIKLKGENRNDFLDIYICSKPVSEYYSSTWDLGKLQDGWIMAENNAVNVFKVYIGENRFIKWVTPNWEIRIISNRNTNQLKEILESTAGEEITPITEDELQNMGVKPMETKTEH